jgi:hypothetical protein
MPVGAMRSYVEEGTEIAQYRIWYYDQTSAHRC